MRRGLVVLGGMLAMAGCNVLAGLGLFPAIHCVDDLDCVTVVGVPQYCVSGVCSPEALIPDCTLLDACDVEGECCSAAGLGTLVCEDGIYDEGDPEDCNGFGDDAGVGNDGEPDGGVPDGGAPDGGAPDGGVPDGGVPDGGAPDGGGFGDGGVLGCDELSVAGRTVFYCTDVKNFGEARTRCVEAGLDLLAVADVETYRGVLEHVPTVPAWVGLLREELTPPTYRWTDGTPLSFVMWNLGEPINLAPTGCGAYEPSGLGFAERACMEALPYLCAEPGAAVGTTGSYVAPTAAAADCTDAVAANGRLFRRCTDSLVFPDAVTACGAMNLQLVETRHPPEADFLVDSFPTLLDVFIGLQETANPDTFAWHSDDTPLGPFQPWAPGEPVSASAQDCVVSALNSVEWRVDECDGPEDYMCETRFVAD